MTALALAGAGQGGVAPDLVLPAGFDRVGEVHRFEQDSGPEADRAAGVRGSLIASAIGAPAAAGQKPALSHLAPHRCGRCFQRGHNARTCTNEAAEDLDDDQAETDCKSERSLRPEDRTPCARCHLRGHVAGDPDRCLHYRGSLGLGGAAAQVEGGG